ncbi:MAG TPA: DUF4956 domain-containing protein [Bacteroidales bacterium]|nr:DUF4956 domain-containing protein [Bacteroidales bacterium]
MTSILLLITKIEMFGVELLDLDNFAELLLRFTLNLSVLFLLVRWLYYGSARRKDYLFSYFIIGSVIFLLCYLLESVKLQLGFALGLFAVFGIIRYRTDAIPIKEMTYLFLVIGISVINALTNKKVSYAELIFTNVALVFIVFGMEKLWLLKHESVKTINYDRIDLIKPEHRKELIKDIENRTGIRPINKVEIGKIDFLKDVASINIHYFETGNGINTADLDSYNRKDDDDE